jgi:hypothetical protein
VGESRIRLLLSALEGVFCETGDLTGESRVLLPCKKGEKLRALCEGEDVLKTITGERPPVSRRMVVLVLDDEDELSSGRKISPPWSASSISCCVSLPPLRLVMSCYI